MTNFSDNIPETLREKIRKIKALIDKGTPGEQIAAKNLLNKILQRYDLFLDEILEEEKSEREFSFPRDRYERRIFFQCLGIALETSDIRYRINKTESRVKVDMTRVQYLDFLETYNWYLRAFRKRVKKSMDIFTSAFIQKNNLFPPRNGEDEVKSSLTPEELKRLMAVSALADTMEADTNYKRLGV